jgi:DNA helicase-2/ATP-dependent DNA helicase PcrA
MTTRVRIFKLEQNYRSTTMILDAANHVIKNNRNRKPKSMWSENSRGERIMLAACRDEQDEAGQVVKNLLTGGVDLKECAVFYRTHAQSRPLEDCLRRQGVPYRIYGGLRFYERMEIKDILAYLRILVNTNDNVSLLRIINVPRRGIGDRTIRHLSEAASRANTSIWSVLMKKQGLQDVPSESRKRLQKFAEILQHFVSERKGMGLASLIGEVIDRTGYLEMLEQEGTEESEERIRNLEELVSAVHEFSSRQDNPTLESFLQEVSLLTDVDNYDRETQAVTLMTLHSAKGLEFRRVAITGLEQGLFPIQRMDTDDNDIEEERRLYYVGLTRAREQVMLSYANYRRRGAGRMHGVPSSFLSEIPGEFMVPLGGGRTPFTMDMPVQPDSDEPRVLVPLTREHRLETGMEVHHPLWGNGRLLQHSGRGEDLRLIIQFENNTVKNVMARYARLSLVEEY